jgi:DNA-binding response OmpR family regulator
MVFENSLTRCSPHILLAEDDHEMRSLLTLSLRRAGLQVTPCRDGSDLLSHLTPFILHEAPVGFDLIISDIRMPLVTGLEILEDLPQREGFPPIILITAFGDQRIHQRARDLGAVATLDKPFRMDELLALVRASLARRPAIPSPIAAPR